MSKRCGNWNPQDTRNGIESKEKENWKLGCRVTAWVRRFTDNCWKPAEQGEKGKLKPLEIQNAEEFIIREVQSKVYAAEIELMRRN